MKRNLKDKKFKLFNYPNIMAWPAADHNLEHQYLHITTLCCAHLNKERATILHIYAATSRKFHIANASVRALRFAKA